MSGYIFPAPPSQEYLIRLVRAQYQIWREEQEAKAPKWVPENIRFEHDPLWRQRLVSLESARLGNCLTWQVVRILYAVSAAAPYVLKIF